MCIAISVSRSYILSATEASAGTKVLMEVGLRVCVHAQAHLHTYARKYTHARMCTNTHAHAWCTCAHAQTHAPTG